MPSIFAASSAAALQPAPATRMWIGPPIWVAAVTDLWVASLRAGIVVFRKEKDGHGQITPASFFSFSTSSAVEPTFTPASRLGGLGGREHLEALGHIDAEILRRGLVKGLLLGLHDIGQRGIAWLVEAQIRGDDGRHV